MTVGIRIVGYQGRSVIDENNSTMIVRSYLNSSSLSYMRMERDYYTYTSSVQSDPSLVIVGYSCSNAYGWAFLDTDNKIKVYLSTAISNTDCEIAVIVDVASIGVDPSGTGEHGVRVYNSSGSPVFDSIRDTVIDFGLLSVGYDSDTWSWTANEKDKILSVADGLTTDTQYAVYAENTNYMQAYRFNFYEDRQSAIFAYRMGISDGLVDPNSLWTQGNSGLTYVYKYTPGRLDSFQYGVNRLSWDGSSWSLIDNFYPSISSTADYVLNYQTSRNKQYLFTAVRVSPGDSYDYYVLNTQTGAEVHSGSAISSGTNYVPSDDGSFVFAGSLPNSSVSGPSGLAYGVYNTSTNTWYYANEVSNSSEEVGYKRVAINPVVSGGVYEFALAGVRTPPGGASSDGVLHLKVYTYNSYNHVVSLVSDTPVSSSYWQADDILFTNDGNSIIVSSDWTPGTYKFTRSSGGYFPLSAHMTSTPFKYGTRYSPHPTDNNKMIMSNQFSVGELTLSTMSDRELTGINNFVSPQFTTGVSGKMFIMAGCASSKFAVDDSDYWAGYPFRQYEYRYGLLTSQSNRRIYGKFHLYSRNSESFLSEARPSTNTEDVMAMLVV